MCLSSIAQAAGASLQLPKTIRNFSTTHMHGPYNRVTISELITQSIIFTVHVDTSGWREIVAPAEGVKSLTEEHSIMISGSGALTISSQSLPVTFKYDQHLISPCKKIKQRWGYQLLAISSIYNRRIQVMCLHPCWDPLQIMR